MIATTSGTTNDTSTVCNDHSVGFIVYRGDPDSTATPNDNVYTGTYRREQQKEEIEEYWERLYRVWEAQWILREGPFIRYDPPQLMPVQRAVMYLKILRCNRRGIGLRIKKSK